MIKNISDKKELENNIEENIISNSKSNNKKNNKIVEKNDKIFPKEHILIIEDYLKSVLNIKESQLIQIIVNCFVGSNKEMLLSFLERKHIKSIQDKIDLYEKDQLCNKNEQSFEDDFVSKLSIREVPKTLFQTENKISNSPKNQINYKSEFIPEKDDGIDQTVESKLKSIKKALLKNNIVILQGNTGCGKTTKLPPLLMDDYKNIVCTQPRRLAAISVAKRVASQIKCNVGDKVGFTVRFLDSTSKNTKLRYVTDGILLKQLISGNCLLPFKKSSKNITNNGNEINNDDQIMNINNDQITNNINIIDNKKYDLIIIDEAHERTTNIDILLSYLKTVLKNSNTKLLIMSATLEGSKFSDYFKCPLLEIKNRVFPIVEHYLTKIPKDRFKAVIQTVVEIIVNNKKGNILVFLTGAEEIKKAANICEKIFVGLNITILKLFSTMSIADQELVFRKYERKIIFSTNIAETSITIDDIEYVVDSGEVKSLSRTPETSMDQLSVVPISQSQAKQRAGRAGRTGPGIVYRVYTKEEYEKMDLNPTPEILRSGLNDLVLTLKGMGIKDVINFDYIDSPDKNRIKDSIEYLYYIKALNYRGRMTSRGWRIAKLPVSAELGAVILRAEEIGCLNLACTVAAILESLPIFEEVSPDHPNFNQKEKIKNSFNHHSGDIFTFLKIYDLWEESGFKRSFLNENFLKERTFSQIKKIKKQILKLFKKREDTCDDIESAMAAGFFMNIAVKEKESYRTLYGNVNCYIHPSDGLFKKYPKYVLFYELLLIHKEYMRVCIEIDENTIARECNDFYVFKKE